MKVTQLGFIQDDTIATPPSGIVNIYAKSDRLMYQKDDLGVETQLGGGGGGGGTVLSVASANGDLTVVNGSTNAVITAVESPAARGLKSATTTVSVSSATAPTTGQVLTATSSTTATWQTPTGSAGPAFRADRTTNQTFSSGLATKIIPATEIFDTDNCYDTTTGRFTPTVAGYYSFSYSVSPISACNDLSSFVYKNGTDTGATAENAYSGTTSGISRVTATGLFFANGSSDYFELWTSYSNAGGSSNTGVVNCEFYGFLAR